MATLRWLHLSDLHCGHGHAGVWADRQIVLAKLVDDAKALSAKLGPPDLVFATGDIAYSGLAKQYREASGFITKLVEETNADRRRVFAVPGNHDVDRSVAQAAECGELHKRLRSNPADLDRALTDPGDRKTLAAKLKAYLKFAESWNSAPEKQELWYKRDLDLSVGPVRVLGLTSPLLSLDNTDGPENLQLGRLQHMELLAKGRLLLVLQHHPLEWLLDGLAQQALIGQRAHGWLTGHVHLPGGGAQTPLYGDAMLTFRAGAAHALNDPEPFTYAWTELSEDGLTFWPRVWVPKLQRFEPNSAAGGLGDGGAKKTPLGALPSALAAYLRSGTPSPGSGPAKPPQNKPDGAVAVNVQLKILFLRAAPNDLSFLENEVHEIESKLSEGGQHFMVIREDSVRLDQLAAVLLRHRPDIVHFSGHGAISGELYFEDEHGHAKTAPAEAVARLFGFLDGKVRCVMLNACYSEAQADEISKYVPAVVGMRAAISDEAAIAFASAFYLGLGHGFKVGDAYRLGCTQIGVMVGMAGANIPVVLGDMDTTVLRGLKPADPPESKGPKTAVIEMQVEGGRTATAVAVRVGNGALLTAQQWLFQNRSLPPGADLPTIRVRGEAGGLKLAWSGGTRFDAMVLKGSGSDDGYLPGTFAAPRAGIECRVFAPTLPPAGAGRDLERSQDGNWSVKGPLKPEHAGAPVLQEGAWIGFLAFSEAGAPAPLVPADILSRDFRWRRAVGLPVDLDAEQRFRVAQAEVASILAEHKEHPLPAEKGVRAPEPLLDVLADGLRVPPNIEGVSAEILLAPAVTVMSTLAVAWTRAGKTGAGKTGPVCRGLAEVAKIALPWCIDPGTDPTRRSTTDQKWTLCAPGSELVIAEVHVAGHDGRAADFKEDRPGLPGQGVVPDAIDPGIEADGSKAVAGVKAAISRQYGVPEADAKKLAATLRNLYETFTRGRAEPPSPPPYWVVDESGANAREIEEHVRTAFPALGIVRLNSSSATEDRDFQIAYLLKMMLGGG